MSSKVIYLSYTIALLLYCTVCTVAVAVGVEGRDSGGTPAGTRNCIVLRDDPSSPAARVDGWWMENDVRGVAILQVCCSLSDEGPRA